MDAPKFEFPNYHPLGEAGTLDVDFLLHVGFGGDSALSMAEISCLDLKLDDSYSLFGNGCHESPDSIEFSLGCDHISPIWSQDGLDVALPLSAPFCNKQPWPTVHDNHDKSLEQAQHLSVGDGCAVSSLHTRVFQNHSFGHDFDVSRTFHADTTRRFNSDSHLPTADGINAEAELSFDAECESIESTSDTMNVGTKCEGSNDGDCDDNDEDNENSDDETHSEYNPKGGSTSAETKHSNMRKNRSERTRSKANPCGRVTKCYRKGTDTSGAVRAFICLLAQYGCESTFKSRNEWKRHVSSQHIRLGFWRCDMCPQSDSGNPSYNDFNRKDLFTQHLKRMHQIHFLTSALSQEGQEVSKEAVAEHVKRCYITIRTSPNSSECLFCTETFEGADSWEYRMDHIAKHLDEDKKNNTVQSWKSWREDVKLREWLRQERLIEKNGQSWKIRSGQPYQPPYL